MHAERARLIGENEALRSELDARDREREREQARSVRMGASGGVRAAGYIPPGPLVG